VRFEPRLKRFLSLRLPPLQYRFCSCRTAPANTSAQRALREAPLIQLRPTALSLRYRSDAFLRIQSKPQNFTQCTPPIAKLQRTKFRPNCRRLSPAQNCSLAPSTRSPLIDGEHKAALGDCRNRHARRRPQIPPPSPNARSPPLQSTNSSGKNKLRTEPSAAQRNRIHRTLRTNPNRTNLKPSQTIPTDPKHSPTQQLSHYL